jgi:hypothetical protein
MEGVGLKVDTFPPAFGEAGLAVDRGGAHSVDARPSRAAIAAGSAIVHRGGEIGAVEAAPDEVLAGRQIRILTGSADAFDTNQSPTGVVAGTAVFIAGKRVDALTITGDERGDAGILRRGLPPGERQTSNGAKCIAQQLTST